jgi:ATP-dependent RNA helicase DDX31/DBP7
VDHLHRTQALTAALRHLKWLVLDEADRLLDMGLGSQVEQIVERIRAAGCVEFRSVLVSATVTQQVEQLAQEIVQGGSWVYITGGANANLKGEEEELADATPRQLTQLHVTVSAKLRLTALVAFLVQRVYRQERTVVFFSTCAAVDFYHALFQAMESIVPHEGETKSDEGTTKRGIFGSHCPVYKLHGNVPHGERELVLRQFMKNKGGNKHGSILLATDVAARGLNLPAVDWIVQFDVPGEISDYVHRAGRVARAGKAGYSLLFMLPSERDFLYVLKQRGVQNMSALSLTGILNEAAEVCKKLTECGVQRSGGGLKDGNKASSRSGEAFCSELQRRLEECVSQDDEGGNKKRKNRKEVARTGSLLDLGRNAFLAYIRGYPTKEKAVRHIFCAKALHLGHVARSFALKEPPKKLARNSARSRLDKSESDVPKRKAAMSFDVATAGQAQTKSRPSKRPKNYAIDGFHGSSEGSPQKQAKNLLLANATKLQMNGLDSL